MLYFQLKLAHNLFATKISGYGKNSYSLEQAFADTAVALDALVVCRCSRK